VFSILISIAFLPWFEEMDLGLAQIAYKYISMVLKTHPFSEYVNGKWQLSFSVTTALPAVFF